MTTPAPRPSNTAPPALLCRGLVKRYADVTAVDGLDLEIRKGECFGLLGPNGAGKTTSIEIFEGLTRADAGDVQVLGMRWNGADERRLRSRIGVQLQETKLSEKLTVVETLTLFRSFYAAGRSVDDAIRAVSLDEKRDARVGKLSGGQQQRLAVACALVGDPELLFLDEPTTGLDPQARLQMWDVVERFKAEGGTVLLTTHYMEEAARLCDRIAVMDRGKRIALGTPDGLIASLGAAQIVELVTVPEVDTAPLSGLAGVRSVGARDGRLALTVEDVSVALPALLAEIARQGARLERLSTHEATLEDVFVHLTGRMLRDE